MAEPLLSIRGLSKRFGGLLASDRIDLDVTRGETHAIIGPNGAGKTTLIGQLAGDLRPDAGSIRFADQDVTRLGAPHRARRGLARSFQVTSIFRDFSALDNVAFAVQAHRGSSFRFWRPARSEPALRGPARVALESVGLGGGPTSARPTSPMASNASSRSRWRWPPVRACCCSTSRWPA